MEAAASSDDPTTRTAVLAAADRKPRTIPSGAKRRRPADERDERIAQFDALLDDHGGIDVADFTPDELWIARHAASVKSARELTAVFNEAHQQTWTESGIRKKIERMGRETLHLPDGCTAREVLSVLAARFPAGATSGASTRLPAAENSRKVQRTDAGQPPRAGQLPADAVWSRRHEQMMAANAQSQAMLLSLGDELALADIAQTHGVSASDLRTWFSGVAEVFGITGSDADRLTELRALMTGYKKWIQTQTANYDDNRRGT